MSFSARSSISLFSQWTFTIAPARRAARSTRRSASSPIPNSRIVKTLKLGSRAAEVEIEMRVHVHAAGQHVKPAGVDLGRSWIQVLAEARDEPVPDADVGDEAVGGGRDQPPANHEIMRHESTSPVSGRGWD